MLRAWSQQSNQALEGDLQQRQESYMRREDELQSQIAQLQGDLAAARGERNAAQDGRFGKATQTIQELHGQVVGEIEQLLSKQAISIKHDEQTQTRRLKNRLNEVRRRRRHHVTSCMARLLREASARRLPWLVSLHAFMWWTCLSGARPCRWRLSCCRSGAPRAAPPPSG